MTCSRSLIREGTRLGYKKTLAIPQQPAASWHAGNCFYPIIGLLVPAHGAWTPASGPHSERTAQFDCMASTEFLSPFLSVPACKFLTRPAAR